MKHVAQVIVVIAAFIGFSEQELLSLITEMVCGDKCLCASAEIEDAAVQETKIRCYYGTGESEYFDAPVNNAAELTKDPHWNKDGSCMTVYTHGWTATCDNPDVKAVVKAYLKCTNCIICSYDWRSVSRWLYTEAVCCSSKLAEALAKAVHDMKNVSNIKDITLAGHSMGGQMAALAAKKLKEQGIETARLVACDPAKPCYSYNDKGCGKAIEPSVAVNVDVIHTNAGDFGMNHVNGTKNYWLNYNGRMQKGCLTNKCSHERCVWYLAEFICNQENKNFIGCESESWTKFSQTECPSSNRKALDIVSTDQTSNTMNVYMCTKREAPYAMGDDGAVYAKGCI